MSHEGAPRVDVANKLPAIAVGASVEIFRGYGHENRSCAKLSPVLARYDGFIRDLALTPSTVSQTIPPADGSLLFGRRDAIAAFNPLIFRADIP
jgi:hypothetical protein